jgi:hypothetical protein
LLLVRQLAITACSGPMVQTAPKQAGHLAIVYLNYAKKLLFYM